jgi:hypothetical protein
LSRQTSIKRPCCGVALAAALAVTAPACGKSRERASVGAPSVGSGSPASQPAGSSPTGLAELLRARGLTFEATPGYEAVDVPASPRWRHEHAVRSSKLKLEIRYGAAPRELEEKLKEACGGDVRCSSAPSDEVLTSLLNAAVRPLATGGGAKRGKAFPLDAVREEFRAHWGGVAAFDADPSLGDYREGIAVIIYREGRGAAMFAALHDGHSDAVEDEWMRAFHSLVFAEPFAPVESEALAAPLVGSAWRCDNGFVHTRFLASTWTVIHVSAAMAVMGRSVPYETSYYEIKYLPGGRFSARAFRVDNMEMGDRTPKQPAEEVFSYSRTGDKLVVDRGTASKWECELASRR